MAEHYDKIDFNSHVKEIVGTAQDFTNKNLGYKMARTNAQESYAASIATEIESILNQSEELTNEAKSRALYEGESNGDGTKVKVDSEGNTQKTAEEITKFASVVKAKCSIAVRNVLQESFSIIRQQQNGRYEIQVFYLLDEESAAKVRNDALKRAIEESEFASKYAEIIKKIIDEGFVE